MVPLDVCGIVEEPTVPTDNDATAAEGEWSLVG
jgi:hypothetical protein